MSTVGHGEKQPLGGQPTAPLYNGPPPSYEAQAGAPQPMPSAAPLPMVRPELSEFPVNCTCPQCQQFVTSELTYTNGLITWISVGGLCLVGLWLGCCLIPLCVPQLKDVVHKCPSCGNILGIHRRIK